MAILVLENSKVTGNFVVDLLSFTPLSVPFLGAEDVHLFFILSGFSLPKMYERLRGRKKAYFLSRLVRLYPPAWISLFMFICAALAVEPVETLRDLQGSALIGDVVLI